MARFTKNSPPKIAITLFVSALSGVGYRRRTRAEAVISGCKMWKAVRMKGRNEGMSKDEKQTPEGAPSDSARPEGGAGRPATDKTNALAEMLPLVYEELRLLAGGYMRNERPDHTLQRTALVHEAYLRLAAQEGLAWENPAHVLGVFARLMRQTLINHAVARSCGKRGGNDPTEVILEFYERRQINVAAVDESLRELEALDPRQAQIVELRFFAGLTIEEIATILKISPMTVKREWAVAKIWLRKDLGQTL